MSTAAGRAWRNLARATSWHRRKLAALAALAAVLTGLAAARPEGPPTVAVVRAVAELPGGVAVGPDDVEVAEVVAEDAPEQAARDPDLVVGRLLAAPVAKGQVLTELALVTSQASAPAGRVVAPLRLADADLAALLRPGDVVDVLAADAQTGTAAVVARRVRVVTVPRLTDGDGGSDQAGSLVLVDVTDGVAPLLVRAAAAGTLTVTWP